MAVRSNTQDTLFEQVVDVTHEYMGPAADRFVTRQIKNHLGKDPQQLRKKDLTQLIDWITVAMACLTEDEDMVKHYVAELEQLQKV